MDKVLRSYFNQLSQKQIDLFIQSKELYEYWNERINVISRKDISNILIHHILHSLGIAKIVEFKATTAILDVGTGGGFPGIPLAIAFPDVQFHLIDSIGKKISVVKHVADALQLDNVTAQQIRCEDVKAKYDFIISRAVTSFPEFVRIAKKNISPVHRHMLKNGILYLKGGDLINEVQDFGKVQIYDLKKYFKEEFFETKKVVYLPI